MNLAAGIEVLTQAEIREILNVAFRILDGTGIMVQNDEILKELGKYGGKIDFDKHIIKFDKAFMEKFINESIKVDWSSRPVKFSATAEIYQGWYLDPEDGLFKEWTQKRFLDYIKIAKTLPYIENVFMLGCPFKEVPVELQPLYEKLYRWKYGLKGGNSIWNTELCPLIYEMCAIMAAESNKDIKEIYNGAVYLISPLKLGRVEAEQFIYFYKKGLVTRVGMLGSVGGTAPVTLAGALAIHLAENFFINILKRAFFDIGTLFIESSLSVMDMSTGFFRYGRPEQSVLNTACAQVAKYLGADFKGHCGLSDAKLPGHEAGVQKVSSAIFNAMSCGEGYIAAGLLGVDEIFSPVQMVLDNEITGALKKVCSGFAVNDETLAADLIEEVGYGGSFLVTEHTAVNFRESLWQPSLWSGEMYSTWKEKGRQEDIEKAKELCFSILRDDRQIETQISEDTEKRLLNVIKGKNLAGTWSFTP